MRVKTIILLFLVSITTEILSAQEMERYTFGSYEMGTRFQIILHTDKLEADAADAAEKAFERIGELNGIMSDYDEDSELSQLSRTSGSGEAVKVSEELFTVLQESMRMSEMTDGLFDITIGPMSSYWRVVRMSPDPELPTDEELAEMKEKVGYEHIELNEPSQSVQLHQPGMKLDLGGIAKGYAAEEALKVLREHGIEIALIDAGGDVTLGDPPPGQKAWDVAVPKNRLEGETDYITLHTANKTVTTSGDLFQFVVIDGTRYSHILTLMKPEEGIEFINGQDEVEAMIFMNNNGNIQTWYSLDMDKYLE